MSCNAISLGEYNLEYFAKPRFHTYDYARHFLSSCTRILGLHTMPNGVEFEGRYAQVGTFPIGIEPSQFVDGLRSEPVKERLDVLLKRFDGMKVIIGVDRLDYIKGLPQKLHAFEVFLAQHPKWVGKVSIPTGCAYTSVSSSNLRFPRDKTLKNTKTFERASTSWLVGSTVDSVRSNTRQFTTCTARYPSTSSPQCTPWPMRAW